RLGDLARLLQVEGARLAGGDVAEVAAAGADVTADEEGGLAVLPALEDVGAARLLAHRVQATALDHRVQFAVLRPHLGGGPDPGRLALDGRLGVARLDAQHAAALGCDGHYGSFVSGGCPARGQRLIRPAYALGGGMPRAGRPGTDRSSLSRR